MRISLCCWSLRNQALQYERGERNDLRVTVLAAPPAQKPEKARRENRSSKRSDTNSKTEMAKLYADAGEEDVELAEPGMADYAAGLAAEDKRRR